MMVSRKWSNGTLSRKKKVSLVVIASTTSMASEAARGAFSWCTSSASVLMPCLRAIGKSRLSAKYCFSGASTRPERSFNSLRRKAKSSGVMRALRRRGG
jgi:hypothetical protein